MVLYLQWADSFFKAAARRRVTLSPVHTLPGCTVECGEREWEGIVSRLTLVIRQKKGAPLAPPVDPDPLRAYRDVAVSWGCCVGWYPVVSPFFDMPVESMPLMPELSWPPAW